ncbi:alpha/beta hydrolase family protein [Paenibacillus caui]|uniref:alpha/beta hydrolase family protein n=1 Tax=Paenibacillus caui TaxID=2873927 RepID=UPI001CA9ABDB|nr:alpha/beta hydrolase [Paenibacillus caui]
MELQFENVYPAAPRLRARLKRRINGTYRYDTLFWLVSLSGLWAFVIFASVLAALGLPTGHGLAVDLMLFTGGSSVVLALAANLAAVLLALIGLPVPRLFCASLICTAAFVYTIFRYGGDVYWAISAAGTLLLTAVGTLAGMTLGILTGTKVRLRRKIPLALMTAVICAAIIYVPLHFTGLPVSPAYLPVSASKQIEAKNPAENGNGAYRYFTYGSGLDLHRSEFAGGAELTSTPVNASPFIKDWSKRRTKFWGFDAHNLPLNGRVWMPEGSGPFPLVLIVHGNHLMEYFSDEGYAYLGELLASRGFIAISVDENFLNYSAWSGIPGNDMKVRAWLLLKHLQQIDLFASDRSSPFYQKVDFDRIGLIGHSRGGQAVAMAADPLRWFVRGDSLQNIDKFHVRSIAALAPTDKKVENNLARLSNINYLAIQGAQDGDVNDFYGDRQFDRTTFDKYSSFFKSTLYVAGANHSQFNTDWGHYDLSFPSGILLSRSPIMDGNNQRQIAMVYVSAFMEATLHGRVEYTELFRDYRTGLEWLPKTAYYNRFEDASFTVLADYEEDRDKTTIRGGGTAKAENAVLSETEAKDRENNNKGKRGVVLEWKAEGDSGQQASYSLELRSSGNSEQYKSALSLAKGLSFSMANMNFELAEKDGHTPPSPAVTIGLESLNGTSVRLPLSQFMAIQPLPVSRFTLNSWLEKKLEGGKYKEPTESVFQTYRLDFRTFMRQSPGFRPKELSRITFYFGNGPGKIMLTDIGLYS